MEAQVIFAGLSRHEMGERAVTQLMESALIGQKKRYARALPFLATVGSNAPFIGLFGTVLGIIQAFARFDLQGGANASVGIMAAISEALIATGVGLLVAIPAVISFNLFNAKISDSVANAEQLAKTVVAYLSAKNDPVRISQTRGS
jgi:biopolymer transport protein ExbB/TolQ